MKTALVTGGGRGIGRTLARELTRAGWQVVVTGRTPGPLDDAVALGDAVLAVPGDAADPADVRRAVAATRAVGELDLVVANAGTFGSGGPIWLGDPDTWWQDVTVNLRGPALLMHAVLGEMVARGTGRVVVLGSGIGLDPSPWASSYGSSKAAVLRLVDSVAAELAGTGVSVFAVSPGLVATDMTEFPEAYLERQPQMRGLALVEGRPPQDCAALVLALASGRYDALSGRFVHVRNDLDAAEAAARAGERVGTLRLVQPEAPA